VDEAACLAVVVLDWVLSRVTCVDACLSDDMTRGFCLLGCGGFGLGAEPGRVR